MFGNFFNRSKLSCDSQELKETITSFTRELGVNFETILKHAGVENPVKLYKLTKQSDNVNDFAIIKYSFNCLTLDEKDFLIYLVVYRFLPSSEIHVIKDEETRIYSVCRDSKKDDVQVTLSQKIIQKFGRELYISYHSDNFYREVVEGNSKLKVSISIEDHSKCFLQDYPAVDSYLLGLDHESLDAFVVSNKILELLEFSYSDISNICNIFISHTKAGMTLSSLKKIHGTTNKYVISKNGETLSVFHPDSWTYSLNRPDLEIKFDSNHVFLIKGSFEAVSKVNFAKLKSDAEKKISELKEKM